MTYFKVVAFFRLVGGKPAPPASKSAVANLPTLTVTPTQAGKLL